MAGEQTGPEHTTAVLRRYWEAWQAGDVATVLALYSEDLTLHYFGDNPMAGAHRGKPAALAALGKISARVRRRVIEVQDILAGATRGVVLAREEFERDGRRFELERVFVYRVEGGLVAECWIYDQDQRLVDRLLAD